MLGRSFLKLDGHTRMPRDDFIVRLVSESPSRDGVGNVFKWVT